MQANQNATSWSSWRVTGKKRQAACAPSKQPPTNKYKPLCRHFVCTLQYTFGHASSSHSTTASTNREENYCHEGLSAPDLFATSGATRDRNSYEFCRRHSSRCRSSRCPNAKNWGERWGSPGGLWGGASPRCADEGDMRLSPRRR